LVTRGNGDAERAWTAEMELFEKVVLEHGD
jgi:hypothetical protein